MTLGTLTSGALPFYGLRLPDWGPYSKYYAGASRILHDPSHGMLDVIPVIGYVRGKLIIPDVSYDCGYYHWDATEDLRYFAYRYELAWKDQEYVDVAFHAVDEDALLARLSFVNNSPLDREYVCTLFAVHRVRPYAELALAPGERWLGGERYARLVPAPDGPSPATVRVDGARLGLVVEPGLLDGMGVGNAPWQEDSQFTAKEHTTDNRAFILGAGAEVAWDVPSDQAQPLPVLHLRYGITGIGRVSATLRVGGVDYALALQGSPDAHALRFDDLSWATVTLPAAAGVREISLHIDALEDVGASPALVVDGLLLTDDPDPAAVAARLHWHADTPRFATERVAGRRGVLFTSQVRAEAALAMLSEDERAVPPRPYSDATVTHVYHSDLSGDVQRKLCNDSLVNWDDFNCIVQGDGANHYAGYNLAPIVCGANSRRDVYVALAYGRPEGLRTRAELVYGARAEIDAAARERLAAPEHALPDTPHRLSQQLLRANLNMNVVYPLHLENGWYILHTPAKRWSSVALWDAGMHALGQAEYSRERALEIVRQFTSDALLSAWGVFPIHILAFWELWQRWPKRDLLEEFYPRLQRAYAYLMARAEGLHSDPDGLGLLLDGSGGAYGIDDYPARIDAADSGRKPHIAAAAPTAYAIRAAKTLRLMARALGADERIYSEDIARLSHALQTWAWNEQSGYYAYVDLRTRTHVLYEDGSDYNMGLDGVSPYVAGIGTPEQQRRLLGHLTTPGELWTPYGLTAVAQNAPYYRSLGYWVGKVWVPPQWLFWKAMLTEGELAYAERVATTALTLWRRETDASYNAWELFDTRTGMGQGAHQFAGLSGPIAALYHAHYTTGRLNVGFDTRVHASRFDADAGALSAEVSTPFGVGRTGLLAAMGRAGVYSLTCRDRSWQQTSREGWLYVNLDLDVTPCVLAIRRA